jgi:hypothetical protein
MKRQFGPMLTRASQTLVAIIADHPDMAPRLGYLAGLLGLIAADVDGHIAERLKQAKRNRMLLYRASELAPDPLRASLQVTLAERPTAPDDFHVEAIEAHISRTVQALGNAQAWLETSEGLESAALLKDIWQALEDDSRWISRNVPMLW